MQKSETSIHVEWDTIHMYTVQASKYLRGLQMFLESTRDKILIQKRNIL